MRLTDSRIVYAPFLGRFCLILSKSGADMKKLRVLEKCNASHYITTNQMVGWLGFNGTFNTKFDDLWSITLGMKGDSDVTR